MRDIYRVKRTGAPLVLLATFVGLAGGLAGCETAPDLDRLAPRMQSLTTEVPESRYSEIPNDAFPNINDTPERVSVMRTDEQRKEIEKSLEQDGETHVKQALGRITGQAPPPVAEETTAPEAGSGQAEPAASSTNPIQLTPPN